MPHLSKLFCKIVRIKNSAVIKILGFAISHIQKQTFQMQNIQKISKIIAITIIK